MKMQHLCCMFLLMWAFSSFAQCIFKLQDEGASAAWSLRTPSTDTLSMSDLYHSGEGKSLHFTSPAYQEPMEPCPAFEARPEIRDWTPFDRLVIDIVNPTGGNGPLRLFVSDSKVPFREGLSFSFDDFPKFGARRYVIPLSLFPPTVDRSDIDIVHFWSSQPKIPLDIYVSGFRLLRADETLEEWPETFIGDLTIIRQRLLDEAKARLADWHTETRNEAQAAFCKRYLAELNTELETLSGELVAPSEEAAANDGFLRKIREIDRGLQGIMRCLDFENTCDEAGQNNPDMLVGLATSMVKIMPRHLPVAAAPAASVELSLARHEWESFQLAVMGRCKGLKNVSVKVDGDLRSQNGNILAASQIQPQVVGFVKTEHVPPYNPDYVGWWPDPILNFMQICDIAEGDVQSFWVRVHAPKGQPAGIYTGTIHITADGAASVALPIKIHVRDFTLPDNTSLPTAIHTSPMNQNWEAQPWTQSKWNSLKFEYADFLADYQIDFDQLYRQGPPDWEIVQYLHNQGRLTAFNLDNVFNGGVSETDFERQMAETIERIRPTYQKAKELGLLNYAYIYGFDERGKDQFPILEKCAQALHAEFPEVLLMTTSYDHSFGLDSVVKTMDAWCPLTPSFDIEKAQAARATGRYVWWYICCGPHNPYANWFVEYAAIETRLLMGAMTAKFRPDGFLYYFTNIWNRNPGIGDGPFTSWNPVSWTVYHGDGSLFHCDKDGHPLPSIRLENFRDGMEDYAYARILEEAIRLTMEKETAEGLSDNERAWLAKAKAALNVPTTLVTTMADYSHDPALLYAWRNAMADAIEASGLHDINPWAQGTFGVRGFTGK